MRVRWRGLELPSRVVRDQQLSTDTYGRFTAEPFERGFGTTVGNSLRRILLSSLEGAAVTHIKLRGAEHEFSSIPGRTYWVLYSADYQEILVPYPTWVSGWLDFNGGNPDNTNLLLLLDPKFAKLAP